MRRVLVLFLVPILAGCAEPAPERDPDAISDVVVEAAPGVYVAENRGVVRGTVTDDAGLAVPGARVQLVGTEWFVTMKDKAFRFDNVSLGEHRLRVEATNFQVHQQTIAVEAGALVDVQVLLLPDRSVSSAYRPHAHDLWVGRTSHVLLDRAFDYREGAGGGDIPLLATGGHFRSIYNANQNESASAVRIGLPDMDDGGRPNLVYPGAGRIEVSMTWTTQDSTLDELGLAFKSPIGDDEVYLATKPSGSTWAIAVARDETDNGHQPWTMWSFYLYPGNHVGQPGTWQPGAMLGTIEIRIEVFKGDEAPVEAAHPDFWGDDEMLVLMDGDKVAYTDNRLPTSDRRNNKGHIKLDTGVLVPPGTDRIRITHTWEYQDGDQELANTPLDPPYVLTWRTADQNPWTTMPAEYRRAPPNECGHHCRFYEFDLPAGQNDAYYQTRSNWAFLPSVEGYEDELDYHPDARRPRDHSLEIIVWNTA